MKPMFLSLVRPDRISSPMTRTAAVTISDALMKFNSPLFLVQDFLPKHVAWRRAPLKPRNQGRRAGFVFRRRPRSNFRQQSPFGLGFGLCNTVDFSEFLLARR